MQPGDLRKVITILVLLAAGQWLAGDHPVPVLSSAASSAAG